MLFGDWNTEELENQLSILRKQEQDNYSTGKFDNRRKIYGRVLESLSGMPRVTAVAYAFKAFLEEKQIDMFEEDLFAGHSQRYDFTYTRAADAEEVVKELRKAGLVRQKDGVLDQFVGGFRSGLLTHNYQGHVIPDYKRVLDLGFGGLLDEAKKHEASAVGENAEFYKAAVIVCKAASAYIERYSARAFETADKAGDGRNAALLKKIGEACRWVSTNRPRSFFEAVQLLWLTHEMMLCEQRSGSISFGRLDKYLFPFYERDIERQSMTRAEAYALIRALWIKFGGNKLNFQNITLGGLEADGSYLANDLTYMFLQASRAVRFDQPLLSLRCAPDMPDELWEEAVELVKTGLGFPAFFNDRACIPAKLHNNFPYEDAVDYGIVGCVELSAPGKEYSDTEAIRLSWAKVLELMLHGGTCPVTGEKFKLNEKKELSGINTFEEFFEWYRCELLHFIQVAAAAENTISAQYHKIWPLPFLSLTMEPCLEQGRDIADNSMPYNFTAFNNAGMANTVDSLMVIKKAVFEEKMLSLEKLVELLDRDYEGEEALRQWFISKYPKFGNDVDEVDAYMRRLIDSACNFLDNTRNPWGFPYQVGFYTVGAHWMLGEVTGALPDGRKKGIALCSGFSPTQGRDIKGPTAAVRSLAKMDHKRFGNGTVFDMKFSPSFFATKTHDLMFRQLIESYFEMGGMEMQFNIADSNTLREAQLHPEDHADLIVRVSGYSAYFVEISKLLQDEIIARTEHAAF